MKNLKSLGLGALAGALLFAASITNASASSLVWKSFFHSRISRAIPQMDNSPQEISVLRIRSLIFLALLTVRPYSALDAICAVRTINFMFLGRL